MRTITPVAVLAVLVVFLPATAGAAVVVSGRVVDRPFVQAGEVRVPLLVTGGGRSRLATLAVPLAALRRPAALHLGDRVRGRDHRWLHVTARAAGLTFAGLNTFVTGARDAGREAAADLRRVEQMPPGPLTGPTTVSATRAEAEQLRERLNLLDARLAELGPALAGAIGAVRAAYAGEPARYASLRRARDARLSPMTGLRDLTRRARTTIAGVTYALDERLANVPPGYPVEIPIATVSEVSQITALLVKALEGGQAP